jgi:hypothetical protein
LSVSANAPSPKPKIALTRTPASGLSVVASLMTPSTTRPGTTTKAKSGA